MNNEPVAWINRDEKEGWLNWDKNTNMPINIPLYTHPARELTYDFIYENHKGYVFPGGAFYAPDYPTWKQDGLTPVYREPVAKTLTDAEFDNIFANGKRLGVLETEDRFRKAMNLTDEEIISCVNKEFDLELKADNATVLAFARAILRKAQEK